MTKETEYIMRMYEAADDEAKDIILRALAIFENGPEEAKQILDEVSEGGLTREQIRENLKRAEALC